MSIKNTSQQFVDGDISYTTFWYSNLGEWKALARSLMRRWWSPLSVEDVLQEFAISVWNSGREFDPTRGKDPSEFIIWRACEAGKMHIHRTRGANLHRPDSSASRAPLLYEDFTLPDHHGRLDREYNPILNNAATSPTQELMVDLRITLSKLTVRRDKKLMEYIIATNCCLTSAAHFVYQDPDLRCDWRIETEGQARTLVKNFFLVKTNKAA